MTTPSQKKRLFSIFSIILSVLILTFWACRKDPKPLLADVVDPCDCAKEVTAEFDIIEILSFLTSFPEHENITDHILENKNVKFKAHFEGADSYKWYIGTEELHTREVVRYFSDEWIGYNIPITLVVNSQPNKLCFPHDDGHDSITKFMHVYPACDSLLMEGWFRVALEGQTDSVDIGIDLYKSTPFYSECHGYLPFYFFNYNMQGDTLFHQNHHAKVFRTYRWMRMEQKDYFHNHFFFVAEMDMNNVYHIYMSRGNPSFNPNTDDFPEKYHGRKLN